MRRCTSRLASWQVLLLMVLAAVTAQAEPSKRPILVSVDDLPIWRGKLHPDPADRERITRGFLDALAKHGIHAVGLVIWGNVKGEPDCALLRQWLKAGHELGNHSYGHLNYTQTDSAAYIDDVEKGRDSLQRFLGESGKSVRFFRFPMLNEGDTREKLEAMRQYLAKSGQKNLPVTIDNQDYSFEERWIKAVRGGDQAAIAEVSQDYLAALRVEILQQEARGDDLFGRPVPQILLLHANEVGARNWDALFAWLERTGHRFAKADEVLSDPAFAEPQNLVWRYGCGLWDRLGHERLEQKARTEIAALLKAQADAWSRGDIDAFCSIYADDAMFTTVTGLTRGRQEIHDRYRRKYPDGAAMGTLRFEILDIHLVWGTEVSPFGDAVPGRIHGASIVATWQLSYPDKPAGSGRTLLVFQRIGPEWKIVQDASM